MAFLPGLDPGASYWCSYGSIAVESSAMDDERTINGETTDVARTNGGQTAENDGDSELDALYRLAPGHLIQVTRLAPTFAEGFLDHLTVPEHGDFDILSEIRQRWGGGTFSLQSKNKAKSGKLLFGSRATTVRIAGEPTLDGRGYVNGRLSNPSPQMPQMPVVMQQPAPNTAMDGLQAQLLGLVGQAISGAKAGDGTAGSVDVVGLLKAFQGISGTPPRDPFGDLERSLGLILNLKKNFGGSERAPEPAAREDDSSGGFLGGEMNLEKLIMFKMLGMGGGEGMGGLSGLFGGGPPAAAPTAEQQWNQMQGNTAQQAQPGPPVGQPPSRRVQSQQASQPTPQPHVPNPPTAPPIEPPNQGAGSGGESEYEPISVDELCTELSAKSDDDRASFLMEFGKRIGFDDEALLAFTRRMETGPVAVPNSPETFPVQPASKWNVDPDQPK